MKRLAVVCHDHGGHGPTLLLLHANGFHGRVFLPMIPTLAPHFRCVALDLPGHGSAPAPEGPFQVEDIAAAVGDCINAQGIRGCYLLGHSLGGVTACVLQLLRPGTFRAMFLFEPVMRPYDRLDRGAPPPAPTPVARGRSAGGAAAAGTQAAGGAAAATAPGSDGPSPSAPGSTLARMARKRQSLFPSVEAAKAALGSKPPFSAFHPEALHAYLACGGLRPVDQPPAPPPGGQGPAGTTPAGASGSAATPQGADGGNSGGGGGAVTLSCAPEVEASFYESLNPPPWRPWHLLTAPPPSTARPCSGDGAVGSGRCAATAAGTGAMAAAGGSAAGCGCRVMFAAGRDNDGVHGVLAVWTAQLAEVVPGAELRRFPGLHHLGPMEDPAGVAAAALAFFQADADADVAEAAAPGQARSRI